jgi:hypothetical protein
MSAQAMRILNLVTAPVFHTATYMQDQLDQIQHILDTPHQCKFCGVYIDVPEDEQIQPADYCHH